MSRGKSRSITRCPRKDPPALEWLSSFSRLDLYLASKWPRRVDEHFLTFEDLNIHVEELWQSYHEKEFLFYLVNLIFNRNGAPRAVKLIVTKFNESTVVM